MWVLVILIGSDKLLFRKQVTHRFIYEEITNLIPEPGFWLMSRVTAISTHPLAGCKRLN